MRKIREILRLKHEQGLSLRLIARSCQVAPSTVHDLLLRAERAGISWPLPEGLEEAKLEKQLYPFGPPPNLRRPEPDWVYVHQELRRRHVTKRLLWEEYKGEHPDGLHYSQFCERYRRWVSAIEPVMRQTYPPGEKLFVDYAGDAVPFIDPASRAPSQAHLFVAVLGASNYTFLDVHEAQALPHWIRGHVAAFEFFGGVPELVIPDNTKTAVQRACFYEPDLNPTYQDLANHYGVAVLPARPRKPRDKAKVEAGVLIAQRWVLARLRHRTFFGIQELRDAVSQEADRLNDTPFQKLEGSRRSTFEKLEKPALRPLPPQRFEWVEWVKVRVNIDYHVEVFKNLYSVPYRLIGQQVHARVSATTVEVFCENERVASHRRLFGRGQVATDPQHRPAAHRRHQQWPPSRLVNWAKTVGPHTAQLVEAILASKPHPEQGYRACLGVLRLSRQYPQERMEAAAQRAVAAGAYTLRSVRSILQTGLDRLPLEEPAASRCLPQHENVRGSDYYARGGEPAC